MSRQDEEKKTASAELSDEELEQAAGGGNVTGGVCQYCRGTDIDMHVVQTKEDGQTVVRFKYVCNNRLCPTNRITSIFYGKDPIH